VLAEVDADENREILIPVFDEGAGTLHLRIFEADGTTAPGDGALLPTSEGGSWLRMSRPVMAGQASTGDLRLEMLGLFDNDLAGDQTRWRLGRAGWLSPDQPFAETLPSFLVSATTSQGVLRLDKALMATPLAWDYMGSTVCEAIHLAGFAWQEILYGQTSIPGSVLGLFQPDQTSRSLEGRRPVARGGSNDPLGSSLAQVLVPIDDDLHYHVQVHDSTVHMVPVRTAHQTGRFWPSARADQRNTAAYPITENLTPATGMQVSGGGFTVFPNPGSGVFQFRWKGDSSEEETRVEIFDLRGHLVARLRSNPASETISWDGSDVRGRGAAAGTYLAVARRNKLRSVVRFVLTR